MQTRNTQTRAQYTLALADVILVKALCTNFLSFFDIVVSAANAEEIRTEVR